MTKVRLYNGNTITDCWIVGTKTLYKKTYREVTKVHIQYLDPICGYKKEAVYPKSRIILTGRDKEDWSTKLIKCEL